MREFIGRIKHRYGLWIANRKTKEFFNVNFIATAEGTHLDRLGLLLECGRLDDERDSTYRKRLKNCIERDSEACKRSD